MKTLISLKSARLGSRRRGFSLVEILVSIAVIGILATILIPVMGMVRGRGLSVKDGVQLRGWGMEWLAMSQDKGRVRHWASGSRSSGDPAQYWTWYLINAQPSWSLGVHRLKEGRSPMYEYDSTWSAAEFYGFVLSYRPGPGQVVRNSDNSGDEYIMEFSDVEVPSDLPWVANSFNGTKQTHTIRRGTGTSTGTYHLIHDGAANVMFMDGHLELAKPDRLHDLGAATAWSKNGELIRTAEYVNDNES